MAQAGRLKLNRDLSNNTFGSWRLDSETDVQPSVHRLPGRVAPALAGSEGFLQTKTVLQYNHLHEQPRGTYAFLQQGGEQPALHRLEHKAETAGVAVHRLSGASALRHGIEPLISTLPGMLWRARPRLGGAISLAVSLPSGPLGGKTEAEATGGLLEPRLPPSMAELRSSSGDGSADFSRLLASSGHGDLFLIHPAGAATSCTAGFVSWPACSAHWQ